MLNSEALSAGPGVGCLPQLSAQLRNAPEDDYDFRTVQELLDPEDVGTTMISTGVLNRGGQEGESPREDDK
jgi:hypothetical protein